MLTLVFLVLLLNVIAFVVGYEFAMKRSGQYRSDEVDGVEELKEVEDHMSIPTVVTSPSIPVTTVPPVVEYREEQKPDLREQYREWIENARLVNELYQRRRCMNN